MGIRQAWQEGGSVGIIQRQLMAGDGSMASETDDAQVGGGTHEETIQYRCYGL